MSRTKVLGLLAICALAALLVGACREQPFEPGPLGAVEIGPGEPIEIRSMLSFTGASSFGDSVNNAVKLAIDDYGAIHGHSVVLADSLDSQCSPAGGAIAALAALAHSQTVGVIGTSCSAAATEASPLISAAGLAMVSASTTAPSLTSDLAGNPGAHHHRGFFRVSGNDLIQAQAVAYFAYTELGLRRVATIHDGDPYTSGLDVAFKDAFSALGGQVVVTEVINKGQTDLSDVISSFAAAEPDGIFFPLFAAEASELMRQARASDLLGGVTYVTSSAAFVERFFALPEAEGVYLAGPTLDLGANTNQATGKSANVALTAYVAEYGQPASPYWLHGYDATTVLLTAIEAVAVVRGDTLYIDRSALREALYATADFAGLIGSLSCDEFGDCGPGHVRIYQHTDSRVTDGTKLPVVYSYERE